MSPVACAHDTTLLADEHSILARENEEDRWLVPHDQSDRVTYGSNITSNSRFAVCETKMRERERGEVQQRARFRRVSTLSDTGENKRVRTLGCTIAD